jgi:hypothetical protein
MNPTRAAVILLLAAALAYLLFPAALSAQPPPPPDFYTADPPPPYYTFHIFWLDPIFPDGPFEITGKTLYLQHQPSRTLLSQYGIWAGTNTETDTLHTWVWDYEWGVYNPVTYPVGDGNWPRSLMDWPVTFGSYPAVMSFLDDYWPLGTADSGYYTAAGTVYIIKASVTPIQYLAVGATRQISASVSPSVPITSYTWSTPEDSGVRFLVNGAPYRTITQATPNITIIGIEALHDLDYAIVSVSCLTQADGCGRTPTIGSEAEHFTVFEILLTTGAPSEREINWNDNGPANAKSDRRDSGVPHDSTVSLATDSDMAEIQMSTYPALPVGTMTFSLEEEADRAAIWETSNRSGTRVTGPKTYSNSTTRPFWLEGIYPNTLDSNGTTTGRVRLKATTTVDGSTSTKYLDQKQTLVANNTYYSIPHEAEYSTGTQVFSVHFETNFSLGRTIDVEMNPTFRGNSYTAGHGLLRNPITAFDGTTTRTFTYYANHVIGRDGFDSLDIGVHTHSGRTPCATSTAKARNGTSTTLSAFDLDSPLVNIHIPRLQEMINDACTSLSWLSSEIRETRQVDDLGGGGGELGEAAKWLDIFVDYVPKASRPDSYKNCTMWDILGGSSVLPSEKQLPRFGNLKVDWKEP